MVWLAPDLRLIEDISRMRAGELMREDLEDACDGLRAMVAVREDIKVVTSGPKASAGGIASGASDVLDEKLDGSTVETVPVSSLELGSSPRLNGEDLDHVRLLVASSSDLPPIVVHRGSMRVIDGMHRLRAAILSGRDSIKVRYFEGSERDAFVLAVKANIAHGLPLSLHDRRSAAQRIIASHPEWSDRAISLTVGLHARTVGEIRAAAGQSLRGETRIGLDGRLRPVNTAERRRLAGELILKNPDTPLREIAREAEISPATVADVRDRINRGEDPVPAKLRTSAPEGRRRGDCPPAVRVGGAGVDQAFLDELVETFESLRRDPMLRFNESARGLLRALDFCIALGRSRRHLVGSVPPLRASAIAELAAGCARVLRTFAEELEAKHTIPSPRADTCPPDGLARQAGARTLGRP